MHKLSEHDIHAIFDASLWIKAVFALGELLSGVAAYFVPKQYLVSLVQWVFRSEFAEDPHDIIATFLLHSAQGLSVSAQVFAAIYLLAHGIIKLWLIIGLLREKLWYYPVSIVIFALFIAYQLYRYAITFSPWLIALSVLDAFVVLLTVHEYRYLRRRRAA